MIDRSKYSLLIFDCDEEYLFRTKIFLEQKGYAVFTSSTFEEFMAQLNERPFDLVFFNWDFSDVTSEKIEGLVAVKNSIPHLAVIITTVSNQWPDLKHVTFDNLEYLRKPFPIWELFLRVSNIFRCMELRNKLEGTLYELSTLKESTSRKIT